MASNHVCKKKMPLEFECPNSKEEFISCIDYEKKMDPKHIVFKEEMTLKFEYPDSEEEFISFPKNAISRETISDAPKDSVCKIQKYQSHIGNWSLLSWICYHCQNIFDSYTLLKTHLEALHHRTNIHDDHFQCNDCNKLFFRYSAFITHVRTAHHETLKLCCDVCNQILPDYVQLSVHRNKHNESLTSGFPAVYHCTLCESAYSLEKELKNHIQLLHNFICSEKIYEKFSSNIGEECSQSSQQSPYSGDTECIVRPIQIKEEYNETELTYQCGNCVKSFCNETDLKDHVLIHTNELAHKCDYCGRCFRTKINMEQHMHVHAKKPFKCKFCSKKFEIEANLSTHLRKQHSAKLPFECHICKEKFMNQTLLTIHLRVHLGDQPFQCGLCEETFISDEDKKNHIENFHADKFPFCCKVCSKRFKRYWNMKDHQRVHSDERPFKCKHCPKTFKTNYEAKSHQIVHSDERPHKCDHCEKCFRTLYEKKTHMRSHFDDRPYQCELCDKRFKAPKEIKSHKIFIHSDERPFECELCGRGFKTKKERRNHQRVHSDERPFQCELCKRGFKTIKERRFHVQTFHSDDYPIVCEICSKSFKVVAYLRRHKCKGPPQTNALEDSTNASAN